MAGLRLFRELRRRHVFRVAVAYAVTAWLLLQLAAIVLPTFGAPHWVLKVLIGGLVLFFPVAIILAWAFEMTPEGMRRTPSADSEAARPPEAHRRVGRTLDFVIIAVLAAAVGVLAWQLTASRSHSASVAASSATPASAAPASAATKIPAKSIAVLPFENLSPDKNNAYFAAGIQDLILTKLADIGGLKVISRTSTLNYGSHPKNLKIVGRQLGVATLLEGSVQKVGDQVLVNVQLINAKTDSHIWAHSYQRALKNVFGVEGEVAEKVAAALKAKLDPAERARVTAVPTHNSSAYDAYLRGLAAWGNTTGLDITALKAAAAAFAQAVKHDPHFALAWAHLSSADSLIYLNYFDPDRLAQARAALKRARSLAPDAAATQLAQGDYYYDGLRHYASALAAYRKALAAAPNDAQALQDIGDVERRLGHWDSAIDYIKRALALDPRNGGHLTDLGYSYWGLQRYGEARKYFRRALAITSGKPGISALLAGVYQSEGKLTQAKNTLNGAKISPHDWVFTYPIVVQQALLTRRYGHAMQLLHAALATKGLAQAAVGKYERLLGFSEALAGHAGAARAAYTRATAALTAVVQREPNNPNLLSTLSLAQAGLGKKSAALASARRAIAATPVAHDVFVGPLYKARLAAVQAEVGKRGQAIATLKHLLARPPGSAIPLVLTPALLRLDPIWDPLRKVPAFQALLRQYPPASASAVKAATSTT